MENRLNILLQKIELLRTELAEFVASADKLTSDEVVKKSQELDRLLTEYYMVIKQTKEELIKNNNNK